VIELYTTPWTDVRDHIASGKTLAVLAFGALEQHGPQLPLGTDTIVAVRTAIALAEHFDALLLPPVSYGATWATAGYPGTVSLSAATVTAIAVDIGRAVASFGITVFVIVNGDFGNRHPLAAAAGILNAEGIATLVLDYPGMAEKIDEIRESRPAFPGMNHAEEIETSMVLATLPETVRTDRYAAEYPDFPPDFGERPMQLHELSASGVFGDPTTASADKGEALFHAVITASIAEIEKFSNAR
jgi:creatinine amidohydrolase